MWPVLWLRAAFCTGKHGNDDDDDAGLSRGSVLLTPLLWGRKGVHDGRTDEGARRTEGAGAGWFKSDGADEAGTAGGSGIRTGADRRGTQGTDEAGRSGAPVKVAS